MPGPFAPANDETIARVRDSASAYGGRCTWRFSQQHPSVQGQLLDIEVIPDRHDISRMVSASWLVDHAAGTSLAATLTPALLLRGVAFESKIRRLLQYTKLARQATPLAITGDVNAARISAPDEQMAMYHFYLNRNLTPLPRRLFDCQHPGHDIGDMIEHMTDPGQYRRGRHLELSIHTSASEHTMAAWIGPDTVLFFDPNYGEFRFPGPLAFSLWLARFIGEIVECGSLPDHAHCTFLLSRAGAPGTSARQGALTQYETSV